MLLLLALLGFTCCKDGKEPKQPNFYGTPHTAFTIKGRITDTQGNPVQGIQVTPVGLKPVSSDYIYKFENPPHSLSDRSGLYVVKGGTVIFSAPVDLQLQFEDIDGAQNGDLFTTKQSTIPITDENLAEEGSWNSKYEKTTDDVLLFI